MQSEFRLASQLWSFFTFGSQQLLNIFLVSVTSVACYVEASRYRSLT